MIRINYHKWLFWLVGATYVALLVGVAIMSYLTPLYDFPGHGWFWGLSLAGVAALVIWRRQVITRAHYGLAAVLVAVALASYPDTSRDAFRYLFDGEMIRLWHLSPYMALPVNLPVDQYSTVFHHIWWSHIASPYGPAWQALMATVNFLAHNQLAMGLLLLKLIDLAALVGCTRYIYMISGKAWLSYSFLINPIILIDTVHSPHTDIVIALALLAAYHHAGGVKRGVLVGAAGLVKLHALILFPFLAGSRREAWRLGAVMAAGVVLMLVALKPLVGFEWWAMLNANRGGSVAGVQSLLVYNLIPRMALKGVSFWSYGLFSIGYLAILVAYARKRVSSLTGLTLVSLLVPLTVTGLVYPWHFIIPLAFLSLDKRPWAAGGVLFITVLAFHAPLNMLTSLVFGGLFVGGGWTVRWVYRHLSRPPRITIWLAEAYRNLYA